VVRCSFASWLAEVVFAYEFELAEPYAFGAFSHFGK